MAIVRYGEVIADIRGSIDGITYKRNQWGAYAQNRTGATGSGSAAAVACAAAMADILTLWSTMDPAWRQTWVNQALEITRANALGNRTKIGGQQLFIRCNFQRFKLGMTPIQNTVWGPPQESQPIFQPTLDVDLGAGTITLDFSPSISAGGYLRIAATGPKGQAITFFKKGWFSQTEYFIRNVTLPPYDLTTAWEARYGSLSFVAPDQQIAVRVIPVDSNFYPLTPVLVVGRAHS